MSAATPAHPRTAKQKRADRMAATAHALTAAMAAQDVTQEELAAKCGVPPQRAGQWCRGEEKAISVADACAAPPLVRLALAEHMMGPGWLVCVAPATDGAHSALDMQHAIRITQQSAKLVAQHLEAARDGHLTPDEARRLEHDAVALMRDLASLVEAVKPHQTVVAPARPLRVIGGER